MFSSSNVLDFLPCNHKGIAVPATANPHLHFRLQARGELAMAEVFGLLVSAAQLVGYCAGIWSLMQDIKSSTPGLQRYQQQIEELQAISELIIRNKVFHTSDILSLVQSILDVVTVINLTTLLQKPRIYRTWAFVSKKGDLLDIFEVIEKKKSCLSLHMHLIQAEVLSDIKTYISAMGKNGTKLQKRSTAKEVQTKIIPPTKKNESSVPTSNRAPEVATEAIQDNRVSLYQPTNNPSTSSLDRYEIASTSNTNPQVADWRNHNAVYQDQVLSGTGNQINGCQVEGQLTGPTPDTRNVLWQRNTMSATAKGDQVNGHQYIDVDDKDLSHVNLGGYYSRNEHHGTGNQVNGLQIKKQMERPK